MALTMESVAFKTEDNVHIVGNYWKGGREAVLLLHMMPATKESWNIFAEKLSAEGYSVLAIDLRGHGESIEQAGKKLNYKTFTDAGHQESILDVEASVAFLKKKGAQQIAIIGASIGANLALQYQAEHSEIKKTMLLSPGTNYRGVLTESSAQMLRQDQEVYFVAGALDGRSAGSAEAMAKQIAGKVHGKKQLKIYPSAAHGTDLFAEDPARMNELISWLRK